MDFLARVAAVLAAGAPIIASLIGITAAALTLWGTFRGAIAVTAGVAAGIVTMFRQFGNFLFDHANGFAHHLFSTFGLARGFQMAGASLSLVSGVLVAVAGVFAALLVLIGTVWLYRKARLIANIATGSGVTE